MINPVKSFLTHGPLSGPLSPKSDQHQFSPNNIHTKPREKIVRINKMITSGKKL